MTGIERALFITLAPAAGPFRRGPIGRIAAQNKRAASLFARRRVTVPNEEMNEVASDDEAIGTASLDEQITKHRTIGQFQFDEMRRRDTPMRKSDQDRADGEVLVQLTESVYPAKAPLKGDVFVRFGGIV